MNMKIEIPVNKMQGLNKYGYEGRCISGSYQAIRLHRFTVKGRVPGLFI